MRQALERQKEFESYMFIADLHALTTSPRPDELQQNVRAVAAAWLAAGLDPSTAVIWRQSQVPEHIELSYFLACVTSMGLLERAHSYKDALAKSQPIKMGLFYYPVLMAADILLYNADFVPVGKDQAQHLEMTRDMATFFNETYGETFHLPKELIPENVAVVPGIDGRKMSKSYGNGVNPFAKESELKKQVMAIQTDSKTLAEPKDAESSIIYQLYRLVATSEEVAEMKKRFESGNYGYGDAKKALLQKLIDVFGPMRKEYERWMADPHKLDSVLDDGAKRARAKASKMISRVRSSVGL